MYAFSQKTKIWTISIVEKEDKISQLIFWDIKKESEYIFEETPLIKEAFLQLNKYFEWSLKKFNLPLEPEWTDFMQKVRLALQDIPYWKTASYQDIAKKVGNPKASRAIGMANNRNPIAIFIPCHRVIGKNGKMVWYWGGLKIKKYLLELEGIQVQD